MLLVRVFIMIAYKWRGYSRVLATFQRYHIVEFQCWRVCVWAVEVCTGRAALPILARLVWNNTHTRLTALFPGLPGWAGTRKVKPIWISLKQETVSGSGISWAICKSAPRSTHSHTSTPPLSFFTGRMPFLPPNQQCQSTEGHKVP